MADSQMNKVTWKTLDWEALDRLRDRFLAGQAGTGPYWTSPVDLANYDLTYAQRIGWKWDAVLDGLRGQGWRPPSGWVVDWGCGSGIAGRRVVEFLGPSLVAGLRLFDQSPSAMDFAVVETQQAFPSLRVESCSRGWESQGPLGTLVVSHVLNELDEAGGQALRQVIDRADAVLWVEPGTFADSRALIKVRESLRSQFELIAPCTHQAGCGLLASGNERHWCHHFAAPPPGIMADADWVRFAQRAGIDLRRLPYSFLVMERSGLRVPVPGKLCEGWSRVIGQPRVYKGFAKLLSCQSAGVSEVELQKRTSPSVFKGLKEESAPGLWRFQTEGRRILAAQSGP